MTAGLNIKVNVIRITNQADDAVGGAVVTGTVVYSSLPFSLSPRRPSQFSLDQGLETEATYDGSCNGQFLRQTVTIYERDLVQVTHPQTSPLYGLKFRVLGVQPPKSRIRWSAVHTTLSRIRESRTNNEA